MHVNTHSDHLILVLENRSECACVPDVKLTAWLDVNMTGKQN